MTHISMQNIPQIDRPRERLIKLGGDSLSTSELIAVLLGSGTKTKSVLELSQDIVSHFGSLQSLSDATLSEICEIKGLGLSKATQIKAAIELGVRISRQNIQYRIKVTHPESVYRYLKHELENEKKEHLIALCLDTKSCLIIKETISIGSLSHTIAHPREIFYPAIRHKAASIILVHNHPSGDPTPSEQDKVLTKSLVSAGDLLGIPVRDHIIIGSRGYVSLKMNGFI